jgi:hypothetical protein
MATRTHFVVCGVCPVTAVLAINITREVPVKIGAVSSDSRVRRLGDHSEASLIDVLEHEGGVVSAEIPTKVEEWVCGAIESSTGRGVNEFGEIVVVAVDDNGTITYVGFADSAAVETIRGCSTDGLGKSKGKETNTGHEK